MLIAHSLVVLMTALASFFHLMFVHLKKCMSMRRLSRSIVLAVMALALSGTQALAESEPNGSCGQADPLLNSSVGTDSGVVSGTVVNSSDQDWYKIVLTQQTQVKIIRNAANNKKSRIKVFTDDCVTSVWSANNKNASKSLTLDSGTYYVQVSRSNKDDVDYTLQAYLTKLIDFAVTKSADKATAVPVDTIVYTIVATNNGPSNSRAVIKDVLPSGLTFSSVSNCSQSGNGIECSKWINSGASPSITLKATVDTGASGVLDNTVDIEKDGSDSNGQRAYDTDLSNNSATASVTIATGPTAVDDSGSTDSATAITIDVLANDVEGSAAMDLTSVTLVSGAAYGNIYVPVDSGQITYTPNGSYEGVDTFTYTVSDINGVVSNTATVTITVTSEPVDAPDESVPTDTADSESVICSVFADVFQTREACGSGGGTISIGNHGQRLDGSDDVIVDATDNTLNTCTLTTPQWVLDQVDTCGDFGDCNASGVPASTMSIDYDNTPVSPSVDTTPSASSQDYAYSTTGATETLSFADYDDVQPGGGGIQNVTLNFDAVGVININEISMNSGNTYNFVGADEFALNIGTFGTGSWGPHTMIANNGNAKNIKIGSFSLTSSATVDLVAKQTIKMNTFSVGRGGSDVNLEAPYVNMNEMRFTNYGSGEATIHIKADYIDIGTIDFGQGSTLTIEPYTPGKRVLLRANTITATSSSTMIIPSGNYYTQSLSIPGTSDAASVIASDGSQLVNFYINGDFSPGNNPGINASGNNGNFGTNPPANFMLFINGDLNTGGGGTTFNATIYVEGDATLGNPTYIRGALSANSSITVGTGQFYYDQSIEDGGWGDCGDQIIDPDFVECGLFPSALNTWEEIESGNNDVVINADTIYADGYSTGSGKEIECDDGQGNVTDCNVEEMTEDPPTLPTFITTTNTGSITAGSMETNQTYGDMTVAASSTVTFDPGGSYSNGNPVMLMKSLTIMDGATVTFEAGDYWIGSWTSHASINIRVNGFVRLFIGGNLVLTENHIDFNFDSGNGQAEDLFVFVYGDFTYASQGGGNIQNMTAYVFVEGTFTANHNTANSSFNGAVSAVGDIYLNNNQEYTYDEEGLENGWGKCVSAVDVFFSPNIYEISENINGAPGTFQYLPVTIMLSGVADDDVVVSYYTQDGNGSNNLYNAYSASGDYQAITAGQVTIPKGDTEVSVNVKIFNDAPIELEESFWILLQDATPSDAAQVGTPSAAKITIREQEDAPICFEDDFSGSVLDPDWQALMGINYTPQVVSVYNIADQQWENRLRLTEWSNNISTALTYNRVFDTTQNLIIVEFDYYAYGGCGSNHTGSGVLGADGIVSVLYDASVGPSPQPGGSGGSMGYAQYRRGSTNYPGFEGGWIGMGIDEYGNFANCNELRNGGQPLWGCPLSGSGNFGAQNHYGVVSLRGDGEGLTGYQFLASTEDKLQPSLAVKGFDDYYSGRYKFVVDARDPNHLYLYLDRDTSASPGDNYSSIIDQFDAKETQYNQGDTPPEVRWAVTSGTGGGCNRHEFSWIRIKGDCGIYSATGGNYRVVENNGQGSWSNMWKDDQLRTQLFATTKEYCVLAGDDDTDSALPFANDIDVNVTLFRGSEASPIADFALPMLSIPSGAAGCFSVDLNVSAARDYRFWVVNAVEEANQSTSDYFSVRPASYEIRVNDLPADPTDGQELTAGSSYPLKVKAMDSTLTHTAVGYDQSLSVSNNNDTNATLIFTKEYPCSQVSATSAAVNTTTVAFGNGVANSNVVFDNVMRVDIFLEDSNWTSVDEQVGDCVAGSTSNTMTNFKYGCDINETYSFLRFVPASFSVTGTLIDGANGFTYLAETSAGTIDPAMNLLLDLTVTAQNSNGAATTYYTSDCYANGINLEYGIKFDDGNLPDNISEMNIYEKTSDMYDVIPLLDGTSPITIPATGQFPASVFLDDKEGMADLNLSINFNRQASVAADPFIFRSSYVEVEDSQGLKGSVNLSGNKSDFLYGRVHAPRYRVDCAGGANCTSGTQTLFYEFYSQDMNVTMRAKYADEDMRSPDSILWFTNRNHTFANGSSKFQTVSNVNFSALVSMGATETFTSTYTGTSFPYKVTVPIETNTSWLVYNRFDDGASTNDFALEFNMGAGEQVGLDNLNDTDVTTAPANSNRRINW